MRRMPSSRFLLDVAPLREVPCFRRFWLGSAASALCGQFTVFAATFAVWELPRSTVTVGALGLVSALAWFVAVPVGMAFIDTVDRARAARAVILARCATVAALAGAADTWSVVSRGVLVQSATPEGVRGRVSALELAVGIAGPHLGNIRAGLVAPPLGAGPAMAAGGLACVLACSAVYAPTPGMRR